MSFVIELPFTFNYEYQYFFSSHDYTILFIKQ